MTKSRLRAAFCIAAEIEGLALGWHTGWSIHLRSMLDSLNIALQTIKSSGNAEFVEFSFASRIDIIDVLAELSIAGDTVVFEDVCIYPRNFLSIPAGAILRDILRQKRSLEEAIQDLGWSKIEFRGTRVANSSSAMPGRSVRLTRRVDR